MNEFEDDEIENDEIEHERRPLTVQQRVSRFRSKDRLDGYRTIEIKLKKDEIDILDAIARDKGISRVFLSSLILRDLISKSGYFISGGKLIAPRFA